MMSFDECPQFYQPYDYVKKSIERTSRWSRTWPYGSSSPSLEAATKKKKGEGFIPTVTRHGRRIIHKHPN